MKSVKKLYLTVQDVLIKSFDTEILNAQALYLADRLEDLKNISFITLYFTDEGPDEIKKIIDEYRFGYSSKDNITRGLYYRGVI